jgi:Fe-S cluster assembly protein SufD
MVSQIAKEEVSYRAALRAHQQRQPSRGNAPAASWLELLREKALESFEKLGFPTTHNEEWKYTNVAPLARAQFEPLFLDQESERAFDAAQLEDFIYPEASESRLVFINGIYRAELSSLDSLPGGVVAMDLAAALASPAHVEILRARLGRIADYREDAFNALNTAFLSSGAFLFIPKNVQAATPIHLLFLSEAQDGPQSVSFPRVLIVAEENSEATVIESYGSPQEESVYWTNAVIEIALGDGARLEHYKVQRESAQGFHIATTKTELGRSSSYNSTTINLGAQLSRHNIGVTFAQEGAECRVDGLYIVTTGQHTDTHSVIDHRQPRCTSKQLYKGIMDGKSRAVFNGKVFVHEGAQGTDAQQTNRNLLLSNEARVDTKPQLEIFADDVKCAHGATVGQLEEEELFYLISRGLHPDLAQNLLTYGFAEEVIEKIKIESIKAQLDETVINRLHARLEA